MKESDIKYDKERDMWSICSPLGVCMYFKYKDEALRIMDEFAPPAEHKIWSDNES